MVRSWRRVGPRGVVLAALALVVCGEFVLRALGFGAMPATEAHRELGWITLPNQSTSGVFGERIAINSHGMRDREWSEPVADDDELRVAMLGDSRLYALGVPVESGFARVFETEFDRERTRTMNFAQPGYGLAQMAALYELLAHAWRPQLVVACVGSVSIRPMPPPYERRDFPLRRTFSRTAMWDFLDRYFLRDRKSFEAAWERAGLRAQADAALEGFRIAREDPFGVDAQPLWGAAAAELKRLSDAVARDGGSLVVLVLPRDVELEHGQDSELHRRWLAAARTSDAFVIDSAPDLHHAAEPFLSEDSLHFSAAGHRAIAGALRKNLPSVPREPAKR